MNFDLITFGLGTGVGAVVAYFINRYQVSDLNTTLTTVRDSMNQVFDALIQERDLTEGLSQELAAQAKLVK